VRGNYRILQHPKDRTLGRSRIVIQREHCKGLEPSFSPYNNTTAGLENENEKQITIKSRVNLKTPIDTLHISANSKPGVTWPWVGAPPLARNE